MEIAVLVNNVGMMLEPMRFDQYFKEEKQINDMINCNVMASTKMTSIVLPNMLRKKRGIIINNASICGRIPIQFLAVYSATKAFIDFFSRYLQEVILIKD